MRRSLKKAIAALAAFVICISSMPCSILAESILLIENGPYICDFAQLVKNNQKTIYGAAGDEIKLDEYTTAHLTYEGSYVSEDGILYLMGANSGKGSYKNGSYIEFTAPSDGTVSFTVDYANYFIDDIYGGYSSKTAELTAGQKLCIGQRGNDRSCVKSLSFTEAGFATEEPIATEKPGMDTLMYTSPSTIWNFNDKLPSTHGKNRPVVSGNTVWKDGEIQFPSDTTAGGDVTIDMEEAIHNNVNLEFDIIGHSKALGQQFVNISVSNREEEIINIKAHPYDDSVESAGITVCGEKITDGSGLRAAWTPTGTTHIKVAVDYYAANVKIIIGSTVFEGTVTEGAIKDMAKLTVSSSRTKTAAERYISLDNLKIEEFTSVQAPGPVTVAEGYQEETIAGFPCRVRGNNADVMVIYLSSELRIGNDNISQLYDAKYIFDKLGNDAVLIAPQAERIFTAGDVSAIITQAKNKYHSLKTVVIGQSKNVPAAFATGADKIITVAGTAEVDGAAAKVWVFSGYKDTVTPVAEVKHMVNTLQAAKTDVRYTEYPFEEHKINSSVAEEEGLKEWILNDVNDSKVVDLVLFSGQSNMAGRGDYGQATKVPAGQGYEYHPVTEEHVLSTVQEPFGKYENNDIMHDNGSNGKDRRNGDMVSSIMKSYYDKTGVPIVGVQASKGGQATSYFMGTSAMNEMIRRYNDAAQYLKNNGYTVRRKFLVWCQGESDTGKQSSYKANTLSIFNSLKSGTGITDCFMVEIGHYNIYYSTGPDGQPTADALASDKKHLDIINLQRELAKENDFIYNVASLYSDYALENMRDVNHFYQPVYNQVGTTAGKNIAKVYENGSGDPTYDIKYAWDFKTDQTAQSGKNVPVVSGSAVYDETNQNIKFNAEEKAAGMLEVELSPRAEGVVTVDFDLNVGSLGGQVFSFGFEDSDGTEVASLKFDKYNGTDALTINGETILTNGITPYINGSKNDGMGAAVTHFNTVINYPKRTVDITVGASGNQKTFTGSLPSNLKGHISIFTAKSERSKTAQRSIYLDNLAVSSYVPEAAVYATGALSITKRMGMDVTSQYEVSKTYMDESETYEWSVSGVNGVTIDSKTGLLTVSENASAGTARVKAVLKSSSTLPAGTESTIAVQIKEFASVKDYKLGGSTTVPLNDISRLTLDKVTDTDGNDITEFALIKDFMSDDEDIIHVDSGGVITAKHEGIANISFHLVIEKLGFNKTVTVPVKAAVYEITSGEKNIDVSEIASYGTNVYRLYKADGSYDSAAAKDGILTNSTGNVVTVVPEYKFHYSSKGINGYVRAIDDYSISAGYGLLSGIDYSVNENGAKPLSDKPIKVDLPDGRYDITICRIGTRADIYTNGCQIVNNTCAAEQNRPAGPAVITVPNVLVRSGNLNLTFGNISSGGGDRISYIEIAKVPNQHMKPTIWIAGDSESANYYPIDSDGSDLDSAKLMMTGFGMQLRYFMSDKYGISNLGQPSATVKTWYDECFESVKYQIKAGDIFLMDFGINEVSSKTNALTVDEMKALMAKIAEEVKAKGAMPVLLSPVYCGKYQRQSYFTYQPETDSNEAEAFAKEIGIVFIDINKYLTLYLNKAAEETGDVNWRTNNYQTTKDNLHLTQHGALLAASFIGAGLRELGYETTDFSYTYKDNASVESGYVRGQETGITREYSVNKAAQFMGLQNTGSEPVVVEYDKENRVLTLTAPNDDIENAVVIEAVYHNDNRMSHVKTHPVEFHNRTATIENISIEESEKIYVWDSLNSMIPLADTFIPAAA